MRTCLESTNKASEIPHSAATSRSKVSISRKTTLSPSSAAARRARSKDRFCAGHQPLRKQVTTTFPGSPAGLFFCLIHRGGTASSWNGFHSSSWHAVPVHPAIPLPAEPGQPA